MIMVLQTTKVMKIYVKSMDLINLTMKIFLFSVIRQIIFKKMVKLSRNVTVNREVKIQMTQI